MPGGVTFVGLSAGGATTCALASNQKIYCWGANGSNQMDNTNLTHSDVPTIVPFSNALYLAVGGAAAGTGFVCIIESAGSVRCKGAISGLPTGQFASISAGSGHVCGVRPSGLVRCFGGSGNKINTSLEGVAAISAGGEHSCALMADGSAKCWGSRLDGRLGDGNSSGTTSVPQGVIVEGGTDPFEAQINACRIYQVIN
jgi:alpha-tubulin suppressor-like RCC1 family protein